ncbi:hypothetical protein SDC9_180033 [bioreactor metagenome]|uniref:Uncharacterized protein n=1 Tax=bioreactor metagenome TaxID=1076179 RepID=A0A645H8F8_9ZZZZ
MEGLPDGVQILIGIHMIFLNVEQHRDVRREVQEGTLIFTGFHDHDFGFSHPVIGLQKRHRRTDEHSGILARSHGDGGEQGGGGGFAVGAGNADGVPEVLHQIAQKLGAGHSGDVQFMGPDQFRMVGLDCGGIHDQILIIDVIAVMAGFDGRAFFADPDQGFGILLVGSGNRNPVVQQNSRDSAHHGTADSDDVHFLTFIFFQIK